MNKNAHEKIEDQLENQLNETEKSNTQMVIKPVLPAKLKLIIQHYMLDA